MFGYRQVQLGMLGLLMGSTAWAGELVAPPTDWHMVMVETVSEANTQILQQSLQQEIELQDIDMEMIPEPAWHIHHSVLEMDALPGEEAQFSQKRADSDCLS